MEGYDFGDLRLERRSRSIDGSSSIAGRDKCASIASVRRVGDDWPSQR
jgi:hypothetical protein